MELFYIVSLHQTTTRRMGVPLTKSCIISFLYIKPQLMLNELELDDSCIISFLYIKPQHIGIGFILRLSCIISFLYIKPQPRRALQEQHQCCIISFLYIKPQRCNLHKAYVTVVLYRFSTSNHNRHTFLVAKDKGNISVSQSVYQGYG